MGILKTEIDKKEWDRFNSSNVHNVALKILNDSQGITTDFLQEVMYHKLLDFGQITQCYGVSQDPKTKNYIIVMKYFPSGNLRKYLNE